MVSRWVREYYTAEEQEMVVAGGKEGCVAKQKCRAYKAGYG